MTSAYGVAKAIWRRLPLTVRHRISRSRIRHVPNGIRELLSGMAKHDELYDADYFEWLDGEVKSSATIMSKTIVQTFHPQTVIDVGCGSGALLSCLTAEGVTVTGLDNSDAAIEMCQSRGLSNVRKLDLETAECGDHKQYDLVVSLEVAEHLPASCSDRYVDLLCALGQLVLFSAATPGQEGNDHVNLQPHEYWIDRFESRGFVYQKERTHDIRTDWKKQGTQGWYFRNTMVFEKCVVSQVS